MKNKGAILLVAKRIIKSKMIVFLAILGFWSMGSKMQEAKAEYIAGTAYQYYLLGDKSEEVKSDAEEKSLPMNLGSIGSGGVAGEFSYDALVNSAKNEDKEEAKQFASILATYSTFNYFSNKVEGFSSIIGLVGRWLSAIVLLPLAVIMDILSSILPAMVGLIAKLNVFRLLAPVVTNAKITSDLATALGIDIEVFKRFIEALMYFLIGSILYSFIRMFRVGGRIDQRKYSKFKGRICSLIIMPFMIGIGATLIQDILELSMGSNSNLNAFSRYLVDVRSWAYNYNFAPNGNDDKDGNITPDNTNSYVDLKFNPYKEEGRKRIEKINADSSLATMDSNIFNFSNSALTLEFVSAKTFSASDYINYKGSEASQYLYGQEGKGDGQTFGSYYKYAIEQKDKLGDVNKAYNASGTEKETDKSTAMNGGYKSAIDDYAQSGKLIVSPSVAWRDRFIYGAKNSGANMDKYYNEPPSYEQMTNAVGTNNGKAFSDQSMYLILSTMFDETGGKYYIDAPTRGALQAKAVFDSNRSNYYVVSMVGTPFFTFFGLLAKPLLQLVVLLAVIFAVVAMGFIDMNLRPFVAWLKGVTLGDIEYTYAVGIYAVGIAGTILSLIVIPNMFTRAVEYLPNLMDLGLKQAGVTMSNPQASLAYYGTGVFLQAVFSLILGYLFWKSRSFRMKLIELFTFCWAWAKSTGQYLERQASSAGMRISNEQDKMREKANKGFNKFGNLKMPIGNPEAPNSKSPRRKSIGNWFNDLKKDVQDDLNIPPILPQKEGTPTTSREAFENDDFEPVMEAQDIARNGMYERSLFQLQDVEDKAVSENVHLATIDAQDSLMQFKKNPSKENYLNAIDRVDFLQNAIDAEEPDGEKQQQISLVKDELYKLGDTYGFNLTSSGDTSGSRENKENQANTIYNNNHSEENHSDSDYQNYQTTNHETNSNRDENTVRNVMNHQNSNETTIHKNKNLTTNQAYQTNEVQQLANTLGDVANHQEIASMLGKINLAKDDREVRRELSNLQESISHLSIEDREKIDTKEFSKSLKRMIDSNKK